MVKNGVGIVEKYKYTFNESSSWVFKSYAIISTIVGIFIVFLITMAVITWTANPIGEGPLGTGTSVFREQVLLGAILLAIIIPLFGPTFVVSNRHQRGINSRRGDFMMACAGYGFMVALFVGLIILDPNSHQGNSSLGGMAIWIDSFSGFYGVILIIVSMILLVIVERKTRG